MRHAAGKNTCSLNATIKLTGTVTTVEQADATRMPLNNVLSFEKPQSMQTIFEWATANHLEEVCGWLGELAREELQVVFVEATLQMSFHIILVEWFELAHRARKHHPGGRKWDKLAFRLAAKLNHSMKNCLCTLRVARVEFFSFASSPILKAPLLFHFCRFARGSGRRLFFLRRRLLCAIVLFRCTWEEDGSGA